MRQISFSFYLIVYFSVVTRTLSRSYLILIIYVALFTVPAKLSPQPDPACIPQVPVTNQISDRVKAIRAKRRLRKKLLARIYQQRRPLINGSVVQPDPSVIDRQLAVRYTRKLLSQLTLRWAHRRYVHKWHSMKRKSMTKVLKLKKKRKDGKLVFKIKKETKENKKAILQEEVASKVRIMHCLLVCFNET